MEQIEQEVRFLLYSFFTGIFLLVSYDGLRIFRRIFPHGKCVTFLGDFFFWLIGGLVVFLMCYEVNDGIIRGFSLVGIGIGMLAYHFGPSELIVMGATYVPLKIKRFWLRKHRQKQ